MSEAGVYRLSTGGVGPNLTGSNHFVKVVDNSGREIILCLDNGILLGPNDEESKDAYDLRHELMKKTPYHILTHAHADHYGNYISSQAVGSLSQKTTIYCPEITLEQVKISLLVCFALQQKEGEYITGLGKNIGYKSQELMKLEAVYADVQAKGYSTIRDYLDNLSDWGGSSQRMRDGKKNDFKQKRLRKLHERVQSYNIFEGAQTSEEISNMIQQKQSELDKLQKKLSSKKINTMQMGTKKDLAKVLKKFEGVDFGEKKIISQDPNVAITFIHSGHMLGAAMVLIETDYGNMLYTGDVGRMSGNRFVPGIDTNISKQIDYLLMESTYGNRLHTKSYDEGVADIQRIVSQHTPGSHTVIANIGSRGPEMASIIIEQLIRSSSTEVLTVLGYTNTEFLKIACEHGGPGFDLLRENPDKYRTSLFFEGQMPPGILLATAGMLAGQSRELANQLASDKNSQFVFTSYVPEHMPGWRLINEGVLDNGDGTEPRLFLGEVYQVGGTSGHGGQPDLLNLREELGMPPTELVHGNTDAKITLQQLMLAQPGNKHPVTIAKAGERKKVL